MKKNIYLLVITLIIFLTFIPVIANGVEEAEALNRIDNETSDVIQIKEKTSTEMDEYIAKYGTKTYGVTAYILNKVRLYSIPFCFLGIAIGAIYQYAVGTRRLDMKQKGFNLIITFITLLVICQVLPLIYTIIVIGWRN